MENIFEEAKKKMMKVIVSGIVNEDFPCIFFSSVEKHPTNLYGAYMGVTITNRGPILYYDARHVLNASAESIIIGLEHELYHLIFEHFSRAIDLAGELGMTMADFMQKVAPFADLVVNEWVRRSGRPGTAEAMENLLTYDAPIATSMGITRSDETFEQIARKVKRYLDKNNGKLPDSGSGLGVVYITSDRSNPVLQRKQEEDAQSDSWRNKTVVAVPLIDKNDSEQSREQVAKMIQDSSRMAGSIPKELRRIIDKLAEDATPKTRALKGWELLKHLLVGERSCGKERLRVMSRISRRTLLPPGRIYEGGFNALFIIDESGSVSDEEIQIGIELVKSTIIQSEKDKVYIVPYDKTPGDPIEVTNLDRYVRTKGGGTDFTTMFTNDKVSKLEVDIVVVLTDGEPTRFPEKSSGKTELWIITTEGGYERWRKEYGKGIGVLV